MMDSEGRTAPSKEVGAERLVGCWRLVRWENEIAGEHHDSVLGPSPQGQIIYTADGHMSAILASVDRVPLAAATLHQATTEERAAAAAGYLSYGGTWELADEGVVHRCTLSLFPNWVGTDLIRRVEWEDERLVLVATVNRTDGATAVNKLVWERMEPSGTLQ